VISELADKHHMPTENLLSPDTVRRIAWSPPEETSPEALRAALTDLGARPWQIELTADAVVDALARLAAGETAPATDGESD
jgi:ribonuclease D